MSRSNLFLLTVALVLSTAVAYEGRRCYLKYGGVGECRFVNNCPQAVSQRRIYEKFNNCGFVGRQPLICCPEITPTTTEKTQPPTIDFEGDDIFFQPDEEVDDSQVTSTTTIRSRVSENNSVRKATSECNKMIGEIPLVLDLHILNGENADQGEFPHMAAIGYPKETGTEYECGGSLISKRYVLTAAHCIQNANRIAPTVVRLGEVSLTNSNSVDSDYEIESIIVHPNYTRRTNYDDIALLKLKSEVPYKPEIHPACLHTSNGDIDTPMIITGWGNTNALRETRSDRLLKATVNFVSNSVCNESYITPKLRRLPSGITDGQLCAVHSRSDTCQGDSGGPLQINHSTDNMYVVIGVTSFGKNCGSQIPAVYTKIAYYLDWIESVVWP